MSVFLPNLHLAADVAASGEVKALIREKADEVASIAKGIAPVVSGAYAASIHVEEEVEGANVVADAVNQAGVGYAAWVEVGDSKTPPHHTLLNALEAVSH